jgi:hypothetical protein
MTQNAWKWMIALSLFATCTLVAIPAIAQGKPGPPTQNVVVINGAGQPVPTAAQGTTNVAGTVNIGNAPNVNVANTPSVNVTNTPTVSLAGGASVNVTNPLDGQSNPTPLAVLDAIQPYEDFCRMDFRGFSDSSCSLQTIPSGKRLVIQEFDAYGNLEGGLKPVSIRLLPGNIFHYFTATFMGTRGGADYFATHQETRLYVASNTTPSCAVALSSTSNEIYYCELSGFLVDVPQ